MPIGFGQAINLHYFEIHLSHTLEDRGWWRRASGKGFDRMIDFGTHFFWRVDQHRQHDWRAAKMRHLMLFNQSKDRLGADCPVTHNRASHHRHRPSMAPAITMEHWHDIEIDRVLGQGPSSGGAHAHQIRTSMMIDYALWPARGAGRIAQR